MLLRILTTSLVMLGAAIAGRRLPAAEADAPSQTLVHFTPQADLSRFAPKDARLKVVGAAAATALQIATGHQADWPGVTITPPEKAWNLAAFRDVALEVRNIGSNAVTVNCRVDGPDDAEEHRLTVSISLEPNESKTLTVPLRRKAPEALAKRLFGMRGLPGGLDKERGVEASHIIHLIIFVNKPDQDHAFQISDVRATGCYEALDASLLDADAFFPMIDRFGQFIHKDWPGKTKSVADLEQSIPREQAELAAHPGPDDWNEYGGWTAGPQLPATGFFYADQHQGRWWLVDPKGRLFWSHGVDCVSRYHGQTPITDREFYFTELPEEGSPLAEFYGRASWAPHGYYSGRGTYRTYSWSAANLYRKYGERWQERAAETCHQRLRSWAMNTIANWSESAIYGMRKTPYVVSVGTSGCQVIEGSSGYWGKFPDPFDDSFRRSLRNRMVREQGKSAGDPWCLGYFVDNELAWGEELSLATAALASPSEQAVKQRFLAKLQQKYESIGRLNEAWGTKHASWDALAENRTPPDTEKTHDDLAAFATQIAEQYFRTCREVVKETAPNNMYLGCRFAWVNDRVVHAAAEYCDVIAYNLYRDSVADFSLPDGIDRPVIIGEFHFGALDRGMFHTGLRPVANQAARAQAYTNYVNGALRNPCIVGSHWFQYGDQATTGRGDGENYQIGLVDICDAPYPETIEAVRQVGGAMYRTRYDQP